MASFRKWLEKLREGKRTSQAGICVKNAANGGNCKYKGPEVCPWHIQRIVRIIRWC